MNLRKLAVMLGGCVVLVSLTACVDRRTEVIEERDHPRVIHERTVEVEPHDRVIERREE